MSLHRLQHSKYAKNMQKICKKYAQYATKICNKYAINMQNMHKSMYLHILHIYALPTLLMVHWQPQVPSHSQLMPVSKAVAGPGSVRCGGAAAWAARAPAWFRAGRRERPDTER